MPPPSPLPRYHPLGFWTTYSCRVPPLVHAFWNNAPVSPLANAVRSLDTVMVVDTRFSVFVISVGDGRDIRNLNRLVGGGIVLLEMFVDHFRHFRCFFSVCCITFTSSCHSWSWYVGSCRLFLGTSIRYLLFDVTFLLERWHQNRFVRKIVPDQYRFADCFVRCV